MPANSWTAIGDKLNKLLTGGFQSQISNRTPAAIEQRFQQQQASFEAMPLRQRSQVYHQEQALRSANERIQDEQNQSRVAKAREQLMGPMSPQTQSFFGKGGRIGEAMANFQTSGQRVAGGHEMAGIGSLFSSVGSIAGGFGPYGAAAGAVLKFGGQIFEATDKLKSFGRQLNEGNFRFAEFSVAMSGVKMRQEMFDIQMSHMKGEARAKSAELAARGQRLMEETFAPMENRIAIGANRMWYMITKSIKDLSKGELPNPKDVKFWEDESEMMKKKGMEWNEWMKKGAKEEWPAAFGRPERHRQ